VDQLRRFREHGVHVLGSFIFGLPTDRPETFDATAALAEEAELTFAQFVMMTPFPGTVDFKNWEASMDKDPTHIAGIPLTRHWLIPQNLRPKIYTPHPALSPEEIRARTQAVWDHFYRFSSIWKRSRCTPTLRSRLAFVWDHFYRFSSIWKRSRCTPTLRSRLAFVLLSKLYRQMYANTGIATDSARVNRATRLGRWIAKPCRRLFQTAPMPQLQVPGSV
jgi:hypothetical protein